MSVHGIPLASDINSDKSKDGRLNDALLSTPDHSNADADKDEPLESPATRVINPNMLKCVLESYGDLQSFTLSVGTSRDNQVSFPFLCLSGCGY